jgi:vacuolar protein sorting-associated protein 13A/C
MQSADPQDRIVLELELVVERLSATVFRGSNVSSSVVATDDVVDEKNIAELAVEKLYFKLTTFPQILEIVVSAHNMQLKDNMQSYGPNFDYILTRSLTSADQHTRTSTDKLIEVHYRKVDPTCPRLHTIYDSVSQFVDVKFSHVDILFNRDSILLAIDFIMTTFTTVGGDANVDTPAAAKQPLLEAGTSATSLISRDMQSKDTLAVKDDKPSEGNIKVSIALRSMNLILNNQGIKFAHASIKDVGLEILVKPYTLSFKGRVGGLSIVDLAHATRVQRTLLAIEGDEMASFEFQTYSVKEATYPGYDSSFTLKAGALHVNYISDFFFELVNYLTRFIRMHSIFDATRKAAQKSIEELASQLTAANPTRFHLSIEVKSPVVSIPSPSKAGERLVANLGALKIHNEFVSTQSGYEFGRNDDPADRMTIAIKAIRLDTELMLGQPLKTVKQEVLSDIDLTIIFLRRLIPNSVSPDLEVRAIFVFSFPLNVLWNSLDLYLFAS